MNINDDYKFAVINAVYAACALTELVGITETFAGKGLEQKAAYEALEQIRLMLQNICQEDKEDMVLDLMDFVSGWRQPKNYIYCRRL